MKTTVCKKANELIRKGYNRSKAFKIAWAMVKGNPYSLRTDDIAVGNTIKIEYGAYDNFVTCTITSIISRKEYYIVNAISENGNDIEFCSEPYELIDVIAA